MTDAERWWGRRKLIRWYTKEQPWTPAVVDAVLASDPRRVIEFGCNAGRHLKALRDRDPSLELSGIDVNAEAINWGRSHWALDLAVGNESLLRPDSADVVFTVSVLDHISDPTAAIDALVAAAPVLVLIEPWMGKEGEVASRNPFTYSWDYATRLRALGMSVTIRKFPIPLENTPLASEYRLFRATRK